MAENVLERPYLSEAVKEAVLSSRAAKDSFEQAVAALQDAQRRQDELFRRREELANEKLAAALQRLEDMRKDFAKKSKYVFESAKGAEEQLKWAKKTPLLSESERKDFDKGKQDLETTRYLALARYILAKPQSFTESLSQSLVAQEDDESSQEEVSNNDQFKNQIIKLAQQLERERIAYQDAFSAQQLLKYQIDQMADAIKDVEKVVAADPNNTGTRLQRLRSELQTYKDLQDTLQELKETEDLVALRLQMDATAQAIFQLVTNQRQTSQTLLLSRLAKTLNRDYALKEEKTAEQIKALRDALEAIKEQQQETKQANDEHIEENEKIVTELEDKLAQSQELFEKARDALRKEMPDESLFTLWPQSLQGDLKEFEEKIVGAMKKFNIAKLKLEDAKPDEIDAATGKFKSCLSESLSLSEYQRALEHYVNDNFSALPGVLLIWEPGTGKTLGATSACVENLRVRYIENNAKPLSKQPMPSNAIDVLILGFTDDNLNDFRNTFFKALERDLKGQYELGKTSGEDASQTDQIIFMCKDGVKRVARVMTQRYSVGGSKADQVKLHPDGIMLVDEAHFMVTREVPTNSTNYKQVVESVKAWERVVLNFSGVKLILTATPSGANRDPTKMFELLKYLPKERGDKKDDRNVEAWKKWFKPRKDGHGVEWVSEEAKKEYEQDWLRARISYVSLRFDRRVFPQIETKCGGKDNEQCIFEVADNGSLKLASNRPTLSEQEVEARDMLEYGRMAPLIVQVPLTLQESIDFAKKSSAASTSANTRNPELAECAKSKTPLAEQTDEEVAACANVAHYGQKQVAHGGQYASGGGFDIESKAAAAHKVIDAVAKTNPTRHLIIASGYEGASTRYFQQPLIQEFKEFDQIQSKDVSSDDAAAKFIKTGKKTRRIALLTGTTWSGSSQTKTAKQKQLIKRIFFSDANADGSLIEILIVDASMLTGFDAKGATHLHIFSPVKNQQQAWSRILRRCAQPVSRSTVYVYTYKTFLPDSVKSNPKNLLQITPDEMVLEAMRRKRLDVQPIDLLMQEMIKDSYDRYWFAEYSSGGLQRVQAVGEGKPQVLPLTQQEYLLWRLFVDDDMADEGQDVKDVPAAEPFQAIGVAAAAQAIAQQKGSTSAFTNAAKSIANRARKAADRFFRKKNNQAPPLPPDLQAPALPSESAPLSDIYQFARDFYTGKPWIAADPSRFSKTDSEKKATTILENLVKLVDMNLLVDLSLITVFIAENLSPARRQQITDILDEKAAVTPPALMRAFEDYYLLQEVANVHYRDVVKNAVALYEARQDAIEDLLKTAQGQEMPPPLPPTPLMTQFPKVLEASPSRSSDNSASNSPGAPNISPLQSISGGDTSTTQSEISAIRQNLQKNPVAALSSVQASSEGSFGTPELSYNAVNSSSSSVPTPKTVESIKDAGEAITYPLLPARAATLPEKVSYPLL